MSKKRKALWTCRACGQNYKPNKRAQHKRRCVAKLSERLYPPAKSKMVGSDGKVDSMHYGGADNPHETIKCLQAWGLEKDALCWTTGKYLSRAGKKEGATLLRDLEKAYFYLGKKIERLKAEMATAAPKAGGPRESRLEKTARALGVLRLGERLHVGSVNA